MAVVVADVRGIDEVDPLVTGVVVVVAPAGRCAVVVETGAVYEAGAAYEAGVAYEAGAP